MDIFHSCSEFTLEIEWISFWSTHAVWDLCSFCVKCCLFEIEGEFGVLLCCQLRGSKKMFMIPHNWCIGHIYRQNVKNCMSFMFFSVIDYGPLQYCQLVNFFAKTCNLYWFLISIWIFNFIQLSDSGWKGWNVGCWLMLVMMMMMLVVVGRLSRGWRQKQWNNYSSVHRIFGAEHTPLRGGKESICNFQHSATGWETGEGGDGVESFVVHLFHFIDSFSHQQQRRALSTHWEWEVCVGQPISKFQFAAIVLGL